MTLNNEQLRLGIIEKLKECDAYIDNELPDYITVMLVNKKTFHQISNDLQLFLGEHTTTFIEWLQQAVTTGNLTGGKKSKPEQTAVETKQQTKTKSDHKISSESKASETVPSASEKDSDKEVSSKGNAGSGAKRRRSEDELELHPTIDWEEEGAEGGKEGGERSTSHKQSRRIGDKSSRRGRGETKAINAVRRGEGEGKSRKERSGLEEKKEETDELHISKSDDLRVLIARKKGERSAPFSYLSGRRHSHSGSEGESEGEEEREGEGRKGGISSVVKVPERTSLSMEGGSRLLQRAIRGLVPKQRSERQRRGGREERGRREGAGGGGKKRKLQDAQRPVERVKRIAVSKEGETDSTARREGEQGEGEGEVVEEGEGEREEEREEEGEEEAEEEDVLPLSVSEGDAGAKGPLSPITTSDDTTRKVELAVITALRKVLPGPKELTDLRELINRQRGKPGEEHETRFVVTMDGLDEKYGGRVEERGEREGEGEGEREEEGERAEEGEGEREEEEYTTQGGGGGGGAKEVPGRGMPERCRFWPNCKNGDSCPFHHPSAQCRMFPNCKYGNKCLFIHPQCKFDSRCTRSDCPYLHTAPRHVLPRAHPAPPPMFPSPAFPPAMKFPPPPTAMWSPSYKSRYPNKAALTWTPGKTSPAHHVSQRQFAVPDDQTTPLPV